MPRLRYARGFPPTPILPVDSLILARDRLYIYTVVVHHEQRRLRSRPISRQDRCSHLLGLRALGRRRVLRRVARHMQTSNVRRRRSAATGRVRVLDPRNWSGRSHHGSLRPARTSIRTADPVHQRPEMKTPRTVAGRRLTAGSSIRLRDRPANRARGPYRTKPGRPGADTSQAGGQPSCRACATCERTHRD